MPTTIQPTVRELPTWLLVLVPASAWIFMTAIDTMLWLDNNPPSPGLHGLFMCALVVLAIGAHRIHDRQQRNRHAQQLTDRVCQLVIRESVAVQRLICRTYAERDTPTEPILRVVGRAAVVRPEPPAPPRIDDEVIDLAQRLQTKVTKGINP